MSKSLRHVSVAALVAGLCATGAFAQDDDEPRTATEVLRDTIRVEGTKKADGEEIQEVPIAITGYGSAELEALFVTRLQDLSYNTPNVQLEDIGTIPGTANFVIRGIGVNSSIPSIDPAVATVIDGVPLALNQGVIFDNFDLEAVEILRGPQGTLFGRNATAGAVVLRTTDPTDEFTASGRARVESGIRYVVSGRVSGPLGEGTGLTGKLAAYFSDDEGYYENVIEENALAGITARTDENVGGGETLLIRPALRYTPNDVFEITTKFEYGSIDGNAAPGQNRGLNGDSLDPSIDELGTFEAEWYQVTNEVNWNVPFGDGVITNITGYRDYESETFGDIDSSPLFVFHAFNLVEHQQFTNELRYSGRFFDRADFTAGIFYLDDEVLYIEDREIPSTPLPFIGGGEQERTSWAVFAQADIDLNEQLTLTLGGRYNDEQKEAQIERVFADADCTRSGCSSFDFTDDPSYENFSPRVALRYQPTDALQFYGSYTEAVRAGGFNFRNTGALLPFTVTDDEEVAAIEFGVKADLFDDRLRVNAAVFDYDLQDLQREVNTSDPVAGVVQQIVNTADATIQGFEAETQFFLLENLLITANIGITDGEYDSVIFDISGDGIINEQDLALDIPRLAPQTYGLGVIYDQDLGNLGSLSSRVNINHRSEAAYTDNNLGRFPEADILDASLTYTPRSSEWRFSVFGRNLLDEVTFGNDTQLPANFPGSPVFPIPGLDGTGGTFSPLQKGRVIGFEVRYDY